MSRNRCNLIQEMSRKQTEQTNKWNNQVKEDRERNAKGERKSYMIVNRYTGMHVQETIIQREEKETKVMKEEQKYSIH